VRSGIAGYDVATSVDMAMARRREWDLRQELDKALRERDEALSQLDDVTRKDLDETRRLLYGALAAGLTRRWELVGTLANALVHHCRLETDAAVTVDRLVELVEDDDGSSSDRDVRRREVFAHIAELTARLERFGTAAEFRVDR
jgi:hypothetical protein